MTTGIAGMSFQTGHVGLNVQDVDRSGEFYRAVFGFSVLGSSTEPGRRFLFLGEGKRLVLTLWEQARERYDETLPGLHHLSFEVGDAEAVKRVEGTLRELGVAPRFDGIVSHSEGSGSAAIFFEDPDGIRLEVFAPAAPGEFPAPTQGAPACGFF